MLRLPGPILPAPPDQRTARLWRTVAALCHAGFAIDPYEAHVLMADFALEDWPLLAGQLPHDKSAAERQLGRHFYEFAANRWSRLHGAAWRLHDLHRALRPGPGARKSPARPFDRLAPLRDALLTLPAAELARLQHFQAAGLPCEWQLASASGSSLLDARLALVATLGRLLAMLQQTQPQSQAVAVALQIWRDGRCPATAAQRLGRPVSQVMADRLAMGSDLACALQSVARPPLNKGPMSNQSALSQCIALLARHQDREARALMAAHRQQLSVLLDGHDIQLDKSALAAVHEQPELLARTYELLFDGDFSADPARDRPAMRWADDFQAAGSIDVGLAFRALADDLPRDLVDWHGRLPRVDVRKDYMAHLSALPSMAHAGDHAQSLLQFGLVPETIAGIARSVQLRLDEARVGEAVPAFFADDDAPDPEPADGPIALTPDDLATCVRAAPYVQADRHLVHALALWTADVIAERPRFVPGYESDVVDGHPARGLQARYVAALVPTDAHDLRSIWTWRKPSERHRMRFT